MKDICMYCGASVDSGQDFCDDLCQDLFGDFETETADPLANVRRNLEESGGDMNRFSIGVSI